VKLSEEQIKNIIREELKNVLEQNPAEQKPADPTGAGAAEIKKSRAALARVKNMMGPAIANVIKLGARAKVNFAMDILSGLKLNSAELNLLKTEMEKAIKKNK
jgi:hypothetical protein